MSNKINVILVDDHEMVRLGLKSFLNLQGDVEVVGEASNGREGVDLALELRPDVVVMDLVMPELDGVQATLELLKEWPEAKILVLTSYLDNEKIYPVIEAGARKAVRRKDGHQRASMGHNHGRCGAGAHQLLHQILKSGAGALHQHAGALAVRRGHAVAALHPLQEAGVFLGQLLGGLSFPITKVALAETVHQHGLCLWIQDAQGVYTTAHRAAVIGLRLGILVFFFEIL